MNAEKSAPSANSPLGPPTPQDQPRCCSKNAVVLILLAAGILSFLLWRAGIAQSFQGLSVAAPDAQRSPTLHDLYPALRTTPIQLVESLRIARISGTMRKGDHLVVELFEVDDGSARKVESLLLGRDVIDARPYWDSVDADLFLGSVQTADGPAWHLGYSAFGYGRGFGGGGLAGASRTAARTLSGPLSRGQTRLVYVAGDGQFQAAPDMAPESFARANPGRFLVVTVRLT